MSECFSCIYVCAPQAPADFRRRCQIPWSLSDRWLRATMCVLGNKTRSPEKATSTLSPLSHLSSSNLFWIFSICWFDPWVQDHKGPTGRLVSYYNTFFPTLLCQYYAVVFPRTPEHSVSRLTEHLASSMDIHTPVSHSSSNQAKPAQSASKIRLAQGDVAGRNFLIDQSIIFLKIVLILLLCFFQMNWKLSKYFSLAAFYSNVMESLNAIMSLLPWVP